MFHVEHSGLKMAEKPHIQETVGIINYPENRAFIIFKCRGDLDLHWESQKS